MKRSFVFSALLLIVAALGYGGCANASRPTSRYATRRPPAYALAVTVNGGVQPTPLQWAAIQEKFAKEFAAQGWVLVTDLALADYIVRVDFTPDPTDPENSGHAVVVGVRNNSRNAVASSSSVYRYPTSFGYMGTFQNTNWLMNGYGFANDYYGYSNSYYDGYTYSTPNLNPVTPPTVITHKPYRHPHDDPSACPPPDTTHPHHPWPNRLPGDFASIPTPENPHTTSSSHGGWADSGRSRSDPTYARTDNSSSSNSSGRSWTRNSDGTFSRTESGSTRADHTYARSDSSSRSDYSRQHDSSSGYTHSDSSSSHSRSDSSSSYSRSDNSSSHSYSRSEPSYSSSSSSSSSSYSSPSYSSPSYSSDSSSSSGSSGSSYSGSSGGGSYSGGSSSSSGSSSRQQN